MWLTSVVDVETDGFMMAWRSLRSVKVINLSGCIVLNYSSLTFSPSATFQLLSLKVLVMVGINVVPGLHCYFIDTGTIGQCPMQINGCSGHPSAVCQNINENSHRWVLPNGVDVTSHCDGTIFKSTIT